MPSFFNDEIENGLFTDPTDILFVPNGATALTLSATQANFGVQLIGDGSGLTNITAGSINGTSSYIPFWNTSTTLGPSVIKQESNSDVIIGPTISTVLVRGAGIFTRASNGTTASPTAIINGQVVGNYNFTGHNGTDFTQAAVAMRCLADEDWTTGGNGASLTFRTTTNGNTSANQKMVIKNNGNVGMSVIEPQAKLHVNNSGTFSSFLVEDSTTPDVTPFIIDSTGLVGIGLTGPERKLHVDTGSTPTNTLFSNTDTAGLLLDLRTPGTTYNGFRFYDGTATSSTIKAAIVYMPSKGYLQFGHSYLTGGELMVINLTSGNVGIGLTAPSQKLEVVGTIKSTSMTASSYYGDGSTLSNVNKDKTYVEGSLVSSAISRRYYTLGITGGAGVASTYLTTDGYTKGATNSFLYSTVLFGNGSGTAIESIEERPLFSGYNYNTSTGLMQWSFCESKTTGVLIGGTVEGLEVKENGYSVKCYVDGY